VTVHAMSTGKHRHRRAEPPRARHRAPTPPRGRQLAAAAGSVAVAGVVLAPAANATAEPNWDAIAACESGGNWATSTGNGFYGGLQFTLSTWHSYGGTGNPANASREAQIAVARKVLAGQGIGAWPVCGRHAGDGGRSVTRLPVVSASAPRHAAPAPVVPASVPGPALTPPAPVEGPEILMGPFLMPVLAQPTPKGSYMVSAGDTLASIAAAEHVADGLDGTPGWQRLADANRTVVSNPDVIQPNWVLALPT
jgi:nucleoid-associated protein YgaU